MKVIFLDIDGVLNSVKSMSKRGEETNIFNDNPTEDAIHWLNKIIEHTKANVVISSTWRISCCSTMMWRFLTLLGFKGRVIDNTPRLDGCKRGTEIQAWLSSYQDKLEKYGKNKNWLPYGDDPIESFVILDDDSDMSHLGRHLVKTDNKIGLTEDDALKAIEHLNRFDYHNIKGD